MKNDAKEKIGIFGGTFNPIHVGHLILAENARDFCHLDKVLVMPSGCSYLKDQSLIAPKTDRIRMVSLAISGNPQFELSTIETERAGDSYTYVTLEQLVSENPQNSYYYIIGDDTLFSMETWVKPEIIFKLSTIVVAPRDHKNIQETEEKIQQLKEKYNAEIILLNSSNLDISSHDIRERIKNKRTVKYYLPESVIEYIEENKLYQ